MRLIGVEVRLNGLISVTHPNRLGSFGLVSALKRASVVCQRFPDENGAMP